MQNIKKGWLKYCTRYNSTAQITNGRQHIACTYLKKDRSTVYCKYQPVQDGRRGLVIAGEAPQTSAQEEGWMGSDSGGGVDG
jgi:hypothetical protein